MNAKQISLTVDALNSAAARYGAACAAHMAAWEALPVALRRWLNYAQIAAAYGDDSAYMQALSDAWHQSAEFAALQAGRRVPAADAELAARQALETARAAWVDALTAFDALRYSSNADTRRAAAPHVRRIKAPLNAAQHLHRIDLDLRRV